MFYFIVDAASFVTVTATRLLAFIVFTLLDLFLTLIRCFSECLTKFGTPAVAVKVLMASLLTRK